MWPTTIYADAERERNDRERNDMVVRYLDLAEAIARRYVGRPEERDDIRQVAYLGLIKAAQRFDPEKGENFVSFAVPTISGEIKRHLRDNGWFIRPPRHIQELRMRINGSVAALTQQLGRAPSAREMAAVLGEDPGATEEAMRSQENLRPVSLDLQVGGDDALPLIETIGAPDGDLERAELMAALAPAMRELSTREQGIVYLRFFEEQTQREIAHRLGITQMQVSRLLTRILVKLRCSLMNDSPAGDPPPPGSPPPAAQPRPA